jgi:hypothetical protein
MIFQARVGSRIDKEAAQRIGERITAMAEGAPLRPEDIVADARPPSSPTHDYFEWDDALAAERYRVERARYYLRNIEIVREDEEDGESIRAFHVVTLGHDGEQERGYVTLDTVLSDAGLLSQVIDAERKRLESVARNLAQYRALSPIVHGPLQATITALRQMQTADVAA